MTDLPNPFTFTREDWQADAACRGLDSALFFEDRGVNNHEAKKVCAGCPVRTDCLDYAVRMGESHGVWGGLSVRERRALRKPSVRYVAEIGPTSDDERCGTYAGFKAHTWAGTIPCRPCRDAYNAYKVSWKREHNGVADHGHGWAS